MDNTTGYACKNCHLIILYDRDAPVPDVCPECGANPTANPKDTTKKDD